MPACPRRAGAGLWLLVAALHAGLWLALGGAVLPRQRQAAAPASPPLMVRWVAASPSPVQTAAPMAQPAAAPKVRAAQAPPELVLPAQAVPAAITDAAPDAAVAPVAAAPGSVLALPAGPASAPRSMRDWMQNDPRSNTPKARLESRIANVAGTPELTEEAMDATRRRVRRNGDCIEVHVSRNAQIDPWNQSVLPTPKSVKPGCD